MMHIKFFTNMEDPRNGFKAVVSIATCGGVIRSHVGEVHSPNFSVKKLFPINSNCIWHIIGPQGHYFTLSFKVIDLQVSSDCEQVDHVSLDERFRFNNTIRNIGHYCGNKYLRQITSSSNEVIVHFVTGNTEGIYSGFSLVFNASQEACGGNLNTESGIIESPGYPGSYYSDRECEWSITVPEGRRIKLEFMDLDVDVHGYVQGLAFFNDDGYKSIISYMREELNVSNVIISSANTLHVVFWGARPSNYRGFRARYSSDEPTICQDDFSQKNGTIMYKNISSYYCKWKHNTGAIANETVSMKIMLNFASPTPDPQTCSHASAAVIITSENEKNVLSHFCRPFTHPVTVRSPYPITRIIGYQDKHTPILQYTINYESYPCGGIITTQEGSIISPGFPHKYSKSVECAWLLKLPENQQIKLKFENISLDPNCEYNYLVVYNGDLPTSPRIGHFCQNNKPTTITSQSNVLLIEYHADERSSGTGFKINYEPVIRGCGGAFHDDTRLIETPSYPSDYPDNAECTWEIIGQNGYHISLQFIDRFYIEASETCEKDFLEVWDYKNDDWISLGRKCGRETPTQFNSTSNRMKLLFRSNDKVQATGFKARWTLHCGGTFEADSKERYIVSPGYPNEYNNSMVCVYKIVAPKAYINVVFEDFALEQDSTCRYDNLSIQTVASMGNYMPNVGTPKNYCGVTKPPAIRQRDGVVITFSTDSWVTRRGFKLLYKTDKCGGVLTAPTTLSSPVSPEHGSEVYASAINCVWNITAPADKTVVIRFTSFEFEHNLYCSYDYVAVYDGLTVNETSRLALLCGNLSQQLPVIKSNGNSMTVAMKTDYTNHFSGFKAVVYFNYGPSVGCGGKITVENSKVLEAPVGLSSHVDCHWEIVTAKDYVLRINFVELNLTPCPRNGSVAFANRNCSCDLVEVRDGSASFSELIDKLCDNTLPREFITSGHTAWLRLYTIGAARNKAFKVSFTKIPSMCGPSVLNVTNQTQVLTSPNYPNTYPNNVKCSWLLKSDGFLDKIDLHFIDFDLVASSDDDFFHKKCGSDRVEICDKMNSKVITEGLGTATVFSSARTAPIYGGHRMPIGIHQFCGQRAKLFDHYSGQNEVVVSFYSGSNALHGKGFKLEYQLAGCNRNFTSVQGRLMNSQIKNDCIITITAPENRTISLHFMTFILYDIGECATAGFEVHEGDSRNGPKLAKLCGYSIPDPIFSNSNKLWIHVWNNNPSSVAFYDAVFTSSEQGKGCGGIFYNYAGRFTSPMYPASYRESKTCVWDIRVPQDMLVALKFTVFDIRGSSLMVRTYSRDGSNVIERTFNKDDDPAVLRSENNHMEVKYTTTVNSGGAGWVAQFLAVTTDTTIDWTF